MARKKKEGKISNFYLSLEAIQKLEEYCEDTGLPKTVAIERFILKEVQEYNEKKRA